jgi:hypothetical protein
MRVARRFIKGVTKILPLEGTRIRSAAAREALEPGLAGWAYRIRTGESGRGYRIEIA